LLDYQRRFEVYGTLAHEFCHLAMGMLYNNNCKPYKLVDKARQMKYNRIMIYCQEDKAAENVIAHVFNYQSSDWHAELIVRVPHLLALYQNDENKFNHCREVFKELFSFYDKNILPVLEKALLEARKLAKELQETHGVPMNFDDANYFKSLDKLRKQKIYGILGTVAVFVVLEL
jgi:hypothetical protein